MVVFYDDRIPQLCFGMTKLRGALAKASIFFIERPLADYTGTEAVPVITISFSAQAFALKASPEIKAEGFELRISAGTIHLLAADANGAMYGMLELAEDISLGGIDSICEKTREPFLKRRGVKFNLPYEPYDNGDAMTMNLEACMDIDFWASYIDFLACHRYNLLSLWSEHPFHMMFRMEKYPAACPYDDVTLEGYKKVFHFIMKHCAERGITVFLITWNIRITPFVAQALGLPAELGDMSAQYNVLYDRANKIENPSKKMYPVRQNQQVIKEYFKECLKTLLLTYDGLGGIGTNCAEEMAGTPEERQKWVEETYREALWESGRNLPFIMRTNMGNGHIADTFLKKCPAEENYISWKYSNAHMYSSTRPKFDELWGAWDNVDMSDVRVLFTVRNDDVHTLRQAGFDFIRDYIHGMKRDYVEGFYWGSDGYLWVNDFQTSPHFMKSWRYDFEKHWTQFWLLGRLSYNPEEDRRRYTAEFTQRCGPWGERLCGLLEAASAVIPAVNRLFWLNYDTQWHPESLLSVDGFKSVLDFMNGVAMPGCGTISIKDFTAAKQSGTELQGETPLEIIRILKTAAETLENGISKIEAEIPPELCGGELYSLLTDLNCWKHLSAYYQYKFSAALELAGLSAGRRECNAVELLKEGLAHYEKLCAYWSQLYVPYKMARVKYTFGYPLHLAAAKRDIPLAQALIAKTGFK